MFTPKNENLYWPFNVLVCRRINKETYPPIKQASSKNTSNPEFDIDEGRIRLKPSDTIRNEIVYYKHQFINKSGDWRVSFSIGGTYVGNGEIKIRTINELALS